MADQMDWDYIPLELPRDNLEEMHHQATALLNNKYAGLRIPARVFLGGRKPTMNDFYTDMEPFYVPDVPNDVQIFFLFEHYNHFAVAGFRARKKDQGRAITQAIWYWQIDMAHSFARQHQIPRFNALCALILHSMEESDTDRFSPLPGSKAFRIHYLDAFKESLIHVEDSKYREEFISVWLDSPYDLVQWTGKSFKLMKKAIAKLKELVPPPSFPIEDFWEVVKQQPQEERRAHGRAWAIQYLLHIQFQGVEIDVGERHIDAMRSLQDPDTLASNFENMGMDGAAPSKLSEEMFCTSGVKAVMASVNENIQRQTPEKWTPWMDPSHAIDLVEGKEPGQGKAEGNMHLSRDNAMEKLIGGMKFLTM